MSLFVSRLAHWPETHHFNDRLWNATPLLCDYLHVCCLPLIVRRSRRGGQGTITHSCLLFIAASCSRGMTASQIQSRCLRQRVQTQEQGRGPNKRITNK